MAGIGDIILSAIGQKDPRLAMLAQLQGGAAQPLAGDSTSPQQGTGGGTAGPGAAASAPQAPAQPEVYQSPPQMMELYTKLMERQAKASAIEKGIGMMGAALAQEGNREGIMRAYSGQTSGNDDPSTFISGIMDMQKQQQALSQKAAQRAAVPAIAAQYGLDVATAQYLFDTGKLDAVIAEAEKPDKQIVSGADGKSYIVDKTTGAISEGLGPDKQREVELVDDGKGGKMAVWKDDKSPVGKNNIPGTGATEEEQLYRAAMEGLPEDQRISLDAWVQRKQARSTSGSTPNIGTNGVDYGNPPTGTVWDRNEDGTLKLDERGAPIGLPVQGSENYAKQQAAAAEAEANAAAQAAKGDVKAVTNDVVTRNIDKAIKVIDENSNSYLPVTGAGSYLSGLPGTDAHAAESALATVKANLGFDKLQQMRDNSPTGAALGPVSDFENKLLQSVLGNVELGQQEANLKENLLYIKNLYSNGTVEAIRSGIVNGTLVDKNGRPTPQGEALMNEVSQVLAAPSEPIDDDALVNKYLQPEGGDR